MTLLNLSPSEKQFLIDFIDKIYKEDSNLSQSKGKITTLIARNLICFLIENYTPKKKSGCFYYLLLSHCFDKLRNNMNNNPDDLMPVITAVNIFVFQEKEYPNRLPIGRYNFSLILFLSCISFLDSQSIYDAEKTHKKILSRITEILRQTNGLMREKNSLEAPYEALCCNVLFKLHHSYISNASISGACVNLILKMLLALRRPEFEEQAQDVIQNINPFLEDFMTSFFKYYLPNRRAGDFLIQAFFEIEKFLEIKTFGQLSLFKIAAPRIFNLKNYVNIYEPDVYFLGLFVAIIDCAQHAGSKMPLEFTWQFLSNLPASEAEIAQRPLILHKIFTIDWSDSLLTEERTDILEECAKIVINLLDKSHTNYQFKIIDTFFKNYLKALAKSQIRQYVAQGYWAKLESLYLLLHNQNSPKECWMNYQLTYKKSTDKNTLINDETLDLELMEVLQECFVENDPEEDNVATSPKEAPQQISSGEYDALCPEENEPIHKPLKNFEEVDYRTLSLADLKALSKDSHIFVKELFFPIHQKYLQEPKSVAIPGSLRDSRKRPLSPVSEPEMVTYLLESISEISEPEHAIKEPFKKHLVAEGYTLYTSSIFNTDLPAITVFAGRKDLALIPESHGASVFLVTTEKEYLELSPFHQKLAGLGYHFLVVNAPMGIDTETSELAALISQESHAGRLTARRRASLLLAYDLGFKTLIMLDDNIEAISCAKNNSLLLGHETPWQFVLRRLLEQHAEAESIITTIQTHNPNNLGSSEKVHRIGWKVLIVNMMDLQKIFSKQQSYFLFPCNLTASSEDAFLQIMVHIGARRSSNSTKAGFARLSQYECFLIRSKKRNTLNSCVKSGVFAQEVSLADYEHKAAEQYLGAELFEVLLMTNFIFNNNLFLNNSLNAVLREQRIAVDIADRVLNSRALRAGLSESCYTIPKEVKTFQETLLTISDAPALNLREPQKNCLKAIAAVGASPSKLLVCSLPTGVGKTRIEAYLSYGMLHAYPAMHSIIVAPTRVLSGQLDNDFYIEGHNIVQDRNNLIPVYSGIGHNGTASSLDFLLQNSNIKNNSNGKIFIFCQKSFQNFCDKALASSVEHNPSALELLARTKMIIFDEEHLTFSKEVRLRLEKIQQEQPLKELTHMLGFTATSPQDPKYGDCASKDDIAARQIIFSYSPKEAEKYGYIRPIIYKNETCSLSNLASFISRCRFTDKKPLLEHVGIMACSSIEQLQKIEAIFKQQLAGVNIYSIYSSAPDCQENIAAFSQTRSHALALVVNMLQEGYNHPEVRYTISLKRNISARSKEQRAGRARRKISAEDNYKALFISLKILENQQENSTAEICGKRSAEDALFDSQLAQETIKRSQLPVLISSTSSASSTKKRQIIYLKNS